MIHFAIPIDWLKGTSILGEIGLNDEEVLVLKKKFFFNDANIDRNDPVQLHLLFVQVRLRNEGYHLLIQFV